MSHDLTQEILSLRKNSNAEINYAQLKKVADKAAVSLNLVVKAAGIVAQGVALDLKNAMTAREDADVAAVNATDAQTVQNDAGVDGYDVLIKVLAAQFPGAPDTWNTYLVELSKATTTDGTVPPKAEGGSIVQSDTVAGKGLMHYKSCKKVDYYKIWESQNPDPSIIADFYRAAPDTFPNSHGGFVTPAVYGKNLWYRVQGCNSHGDGPLSDPFGGFPFHPGLG